MKRTILTIILILLIAVFCVSGYMLYDYYHQYAVGDDFYSKIADEATSAQTAQAGSAKDSKSAKGEGADISIDFDDLLSVNDKTVGWLYSESTVINYPVVYPRDNSYYLTHLLDGTRNKNGTLFIDSRNAEPFTDANTIIYGHHMKSGKMFASLVNYGKQSYYDEHPYMYYLSPSGNYRLEIISSFVTESTSFAYQRTFESEEDHAAFLEKIKKKSDIKSKYEVTTNDKLVVLSTCTYEFADARYVVFAKLTPIAS